MDDKDYSLKGNDRDEWDRLWGECTLRLLPGECRLHLPVRYESLKVKALFLSTDPPQFADRVRRESDECPVCGATTASGQRIAAHLTVEYLRPKDWTFMAEPTEFIGVWAHPSCIERCPDTGRPSGIPW